MTRRARYDGPHDAVDVPLPSGRWITVERGHQLPTEVKHPRTGEVESVPASLRDQLITQGWAAVEQSTAAPKKGEEE